MHPAAFVAFDTKNALMQAVADRLADLLSDDIAETGRACALLSGGSTPEPAYALLARADLEWSKITFALVDERCVPAEEPASNEGMLRRALAPALAKGATLMPLFVPAEDVAAACARHQALTPTVALLGMGLDGHTASWFPAAAGLGEALALDNPRCIVAVHAPQAAGAARRLTLTRPAIARAKHVILLITGVDKQERLTQALAGPLEDNPVAALFAPEMPPVETLWAP